MLLAGYGWLRLRFVNEPTLLILTYHRILPVDAPERSCEQPGMVTSPELLTKHINLVRKFGAEPIHLDDWLERKQSKKNLPRLAVAFTFDDGWRDNFQYAYPQLKAQNIPATIFLVTRLVDTCETFWPEHILRLLTSSPDAEVNIQHQWLVPFLNREDAYSLPLSLDKADKVISKLKALPDEVIYNHLKKIKRGYDTAEELSQNRSILSKQEIAEMGESGLVKFGAHTRNHLRLNFLHDQEILRTEIVDCFEDMQFLGNMAIPIFCYPNGNVTSKAEELVRKTYRAACTTKTGWNPAASRSSYDLHRFNLHDGNSLSVLHFLATIGRAIL
ncbi:polysaccharide deacetylase family protein [Marinobacter adhaerens]|nr:polysaccharide deacetylase family protein [Marinobacter adhaerens]